MIVNASRTTILLTFSFFIRCDADAIRTVFFCNYFVVCNSGHEEKSVFFSKGKKRRKTHDATMVHWHTHTHNRHSLNSIFVQFYLLLLLLSHGKSQLLIIERYETIKYYDYFWVIQTFFNVKFQSERMFASEKRSFRTRIDFETFFF